MKVAENPDVFDKLAEKLGEKLYDRAWDVSGINEKLDTVLAKLTDHDSRFDNIDTDIRDLRQRFERADKRLDNIDRHLGINSNKGESS